MSGSADPEGAPDRQYRIAVRFHTGPETERIEAIPEDRTHRYRGVVLAGTSGKRITRLRAARRLADVRADLTAEHAARSETAATDTPTGSDGPQSGLPPLGAGRGARAEIAAPLPFPSRGPHHKTCLVRLRGPLNRARRAGLAEIDARLVAFRPPGTYRLRLTPGQRDLVADLPWVSAVRPWCLTVPDGPHSGDLGVVMAWTDRSGSTVQNNLDLAVPAPDGTLHMGNEGHAYNKVPSLDHSAEARLTGTPAPGTYTIKVFAQNTPFSAQGYAVWAAGPVSEEELRMP
ncbi:hypothetical protein ACGF3G_41475 [Streptomyces sp. NPDC048179]|uniref:hypothetical protein n=1 Tax=Streptomyces sp. NPDC048179 TaxID=3365506 RepID=UPI00371B6A39